MRKSPSSISIIRVPFSIRKTSICHHSPTDFHLFHSEHLSQLFLLFYTEIMNFRRSVIVMLLVTLLAPVLLYTGRLGRFTNHWSSKSELLADSSSSWDSFKVTEVHNKAMLYYNSTVRDVDPSVSIMKTISLAQETEEFKSRMLYMISDGIKSVKENNTEQAVGSFSEGHQSAIFRRIQHVNDGNKEAEKLHSQDGGMPRWIKRTFKTMELNNKNTLVERKIDLSESIKQKTTKHDGKRILPDSRVRHMKDLLIRAKVYSSMANTRNNPHSTRELRQRVKEVQKALGAATQDSDLPRNSYDKAKAMEQVLSRGTHVNNDCTGIVKKLRAMLHSTEEQLRAQKKQTLFLTQISSKTVSKGLHCLPLTLSTAYYLMSSSQQHLPNDHKLDHPKLYHYALLSDNILATAVAVNSTIFNAKEPSSHIFHIMTDKLNYAAMKKWFLSNPPGKATVEVRNVDEFDWLNATYIPTMKQANHTPSNDYSTKSRRVISAESGFKFENPKYLSILNHLRFYLPYMLPNLDKVLFLDDDVVVQRDLTELWYIDLKGKVNAAVGSCGENYCRLDRYVNFPNSIISENFDPKASVWSFGMNVFDLKEWRRQHITEIYHNWQKMNEGKQLWKLGSLPPGLLTFWNHTYLLPQEWHLTGLGYDPDISEALIERAAVIHYNGNLKPWLEVGIPRYRNYWSMFLDYNNPHLRECNINPL